MADDLNLNELIERGALQIKDEHPQDRASKIKIKEANAELALWREKLTVKFVLWTLFLGIVCSVIGLVCGDASTKELCGKTLTAIISGVVGYGFGKQEAKKSDD